MSDFVAIREDGRWECPHCGGQIDTFADSETVASIVTAAVEAERAAPALDAVKAEALPPGVPDLLAHLSAAVDRARAARIARGSRTADETEA